MQDKNIDVEINAILNSLDNISPAQPRPFFYGRVLNRLEKKPQHFWDKLAVFITNPAFAITTIALVLSIDGALLLNTEEAPTPVNENSISAQYTEFYDTNQDFYSLTYDEIASNNP